MCAEVLFFASALTEIMVVLAVWVIVDVYLADPAETVVLDSIVVGKNSHGSLSQDSVAMAAPWKVTVMQSSELVLVDELAELSLITVFVVVLVGAATAFACSLGGATIVMLKIVTTTVVIVVASSLLVAICGSIEGLLVSPSSEVLEDSLEVLEVGDD